MKDFKEYRKITEFSGCRMRIMPTFIGQVQTQFGPHDVVYADVTVLWPSSEQPVPAVAIFQRMLIGQIKSWWDGRPITGTLRKRHVGDSRLRGMEEAWILDDVEVG